MDRPWCARARAGCRNRAMPLSELSFSITSVPEGIIPIGTPCSPACSPPAVRDVSPLVAGPHLTWKLHEGREPAGLAQPHTLEPAPGLAHGAQGGVVPESRCHLKLLTFQDALVRGHSCLTPQLWNEAVLSVAAHFFRGPFPGLPLAPAARPHALEVG